MVVFCFPVHMVCIQFISNKSLCIVQQKFSSDILTQVQTGWRYFVFSKKFTLNLKVYAENISITKKSITGSFMPIPLTAIYLLKHLISFIFFPDILKYNLYGER